MANVQGGNATGPSRIRTVTKSAVESQAVIIDIGGEGAETLLTAGQQLAALSIPVVLTAAQLTSLTAPVLGAGIAVIGHVIVDSAPTTAVTGTFWQATQPVSLVTLPALAAGSAAIGTVGLGPTVTAQDQWALAQSANSTTTGTTFTALVPTTSTPAASSSRSVITWVGRSQLLLQFFGKNANNLTFKARISGWKQASGLWTSTPICEVTVTLSSSLPGVAASTVDNTNLFADTITLSGSTGIGVVYSSPADDTGIATLEVPIPAPFSFVEIQFIRTASATEANALYSTF